MDIITLDFETYYDKKGFSLSKMPTEAYIRGDRFQVFGCGLKVNDHPAVWVAGEDDVRLVLESLELDKNAVLCHNAQFDGFILSHIYDMKPKAWLDTLSMARATIGVQAMGSSLAKLAKFFGVGEKGTELESLDGVVNPTPAQLRVLGEYCKNDVELTYKIFKIMSETYPKSEYKVIDMVIRMFTEPVLRLDYSLLKDYLEEVQAHKLALLLDSGAAQGDLMSNPKFAELLTRAGVYPPTKISIRTGKEAYAFAKTDAGMKALLEHPDENVQVLVAARLGVKSTINETRAQTFMDISQRGTAPVFLNYSGAGQTHRLSGGQGSNYQNLGKGSKLREAVTAPEGFTLVAVDSSTIEARILNYMAGQTDIVDVFRMSDRKECEDVYCFMASKIYGYEVKKAEHKAQRQMGKIATLGLGFGMSAEKFVATCANMNETVSLDEAKEIVRIYRSVHHKVVEFWKRCGSAIPMMQSGDEDSVVDIHGRVKIEKGALALPNGLKIRYPDLAYEDNNWVFNGGRGVTKTYSSKVAENIIQALARNVVMEQTVSLASRWKLVLSVHDEAVFCVPNDQVKICVEDCEAVFSKAPSWAPGLPLNCEVAYGRNYSQCK